MKSLNYILILTVYISLFAFDILSQPSITWQKYYSRSISSEDFGYDACESDNGNFFIVGSSNTRMYIIKIKPNGDTIWTRRFPVDTADIAFSCVSSGDGGCIITGSFDRPFAMKINSDASVAWYKQYNNSIVYAKIFDIIKTSDNNYVMCGEINGGNSGYILKINNNGDFIWDKYFISTSFRRFTSITEAAGSGYVAVSDYRDQPGVTDAVLKLNINGDVLWERLYSGGTQVIEKIGNSSCIIFPRRLTEMGDEYGTHLGFTVADSSGHLLYSKSIDVNPFEVFYGAKVLSSNRIVYSTYYETGIIHAPTFCILRIIDTLGNIITEKTIENKSAGFNWLRSIHKLNNGDILFAGEGAINDTSNNDFFAIRTDSMLNIKPIGIHQAGSEVPDGFLLGQNYPNPFNPVTNIKFDIPKDGFVSLKIYDILSREIYTVNEFRTSGSHTVQFDGANYASGMYFYQFEAGNYKETKKMVLLK